MAGQRNPGTSNPMFTGKYYKGFQQGNPPSGFLNPNPTRPPQGQNPQSGFLNPNPTRPPQSNPQSGFLNPNPSNPTRPPQGQIVGGFQPSFQPGTSTRQQSSLFPTGNTPNQTSSSFPQTGGFKQPGIQQTRGFAPQGGQGFQPPAGIPSRTGQTGQNLFPIGNPGQSSNLFPQTIPASSTPTNLFPTPSSTQSTLLPPSTTKPGQTGFLPPFSTGGSLFPSTTPSQSSHTTQQRPSLFPVQPAVTQSGQSLFPQTTGSVVNPQGLFPSSSKPIAPGGFPSTSSVIPSSQKTEGFVPVTPSSQTTGGLFPTASLNPSTSKPQTTGGLFPSAGFNPASSQSQKNLFPSVPGTQTTTGGLFPSQGVNLPSSQPQTSQSLLPSASQAAVPGFTPSSTQAGLPTASSVPLIPGQNQGVISVSQAPQQVQIPGQVAIQQLSKSVRDKVQKKSIEEFSRN